MGETPLAEMGKRLTALNVEIRIRKENGLITRKYEHSKTCPSFYPQCFSEEFPADHLQGTCVSI